MIIGCNGYLDKLIKNIRNKFMPINNYVIATEPLGEKKREKLLRIIMQYVIHVLL